MALSVLHVTYSLHMGSGGPIKAITDLSSSSQRLGLHSEIVGPAPCLLPETDLPEDLIHVMPNPRLGGYGYSSGYRPWLRSNIRRFDGAILHGMWHYANVVAHQECRSAGVPYVWFPHGMFDPYCIDRQGPWKKIKKHAYWCLVDRNVFERADAVFYTTPRERRRAETIAPFGGPPNRIIIPYGTSESGARAEEPASASLKNFKYMKFCLFLGRLDPKKNLDFLIRCWQDANLDSTWHLVIAGSGDARHSNSLHRLVQRLDLEQRVHFVGHVHGVDKIFLLQHAKWFLLPSAQENFGIAVLEAIQERCPVVISDEVYLADHLPPETLVLPVTRDAWLGFFREKLDDEALRSSLSETLHAHICATFAIERIATRWVEALDKIFTKKASIT